jgi:tRNA-dihydrouridine synthase 3
VAGESRENAARGQDRDRRGESLRMIKRRNAEQRRNDLCRYTVQGEVCKLGKRCGYSHDLEAYVRSKPNDVKGAACVFVTAANEKCPFGVRCRFASSHGKLTSARKVDFATNLLDDAMQKRLSKNEYPFKRSDAALAKAELELKCLSFAQKGKLDRKQGFLGPFEPGCVNTRERRKELDFKGKLYVAPLTTVGNLPFRRVCTDLGADITVSEMAMASNLLKGDRKEWALLRRHPSEKCYGIQVCGGYPDLMARCAELIDNEVSCDFIDVNMGCPIDGVCAKGAGSSLMRDTDRLKNVVRTMAAVSSTPVTIKLRMGYFDDPSKYVAHDIIPRAKAWGAFAATLHGRTREQRYSRLADWSYIHRCADVAAKSEFTLIGNGDVYTYEDYNAQVADNKVATCMIGRGAIIKPWLMTEIKEQRHWDISANERLDLFKDFCQYGLEHWGSDSMGVEKTRRYLLEWMSYTHRYVPIGLLEQNVVPKLHLRPMRYVGRSDLETKLASDRLEDWLELSEICGLGKPDASFKFVPKHASNSYTKESADAAASWVDVGEENG